MKIWRPFHVIWNFLFFMYVTNCALHMLVVIAAILSPYFTSTNSQYHLLVVSIFKTHLLKSLNIKQQNKDPYVVNSMKMSNIFPLINLQV